MANTKTPGKNGAQHAAGLENGNGTRSAAGLVVAGLVTVIGSWIGMAAYMDYRLQSMEERINNGTKQQVAAAADVTRTTLNTSVAQLTQGVNSKIDSTSSILAGGILEIKQSQSQMTNDILTANTLTEQLNELKNSIQTFVAEKQGALQDNLVQLAAKVEEGNLNTYRTVESVAQANRSSQEAILAAIQGVDSNLAEVNSSLLAHMDTNVKSLEDLVRTNQETNAKQLSDLAANVTSISSGANENSQQINSELSSLAEKVTSLSDEFTASQDSMRTLSESLPQWQKSGQELINQWMESAKTSNQDLQTQVGEIQTKFQEMSQRLDSANESLMRALYVTSEGMEGTKVEIKSELENSKQTTSTEIKNLAQSLQDVSKQIESIKQNISTQTTGAQSSSTPFTQTPEFEKLVASLQSISLKTGDLRSQIDSQVNEVKTRTETLLGQDSASEKAGAMRDMLKNFTSLAETAGGQLDTLIEGLQNVSLMVDGLRGVKISQESESSPTPSDSGQSPAIGMNSEDRSPETQNFPQP